MLDLEPTLQRIARGERLDFQDDDSPFLNQDGKLPAKPDGYYRQFVLPTAQLAGPGPQWVVTAAAAKSIILPIAGAIARTDTLNPRTPISAEAGLDASQIRQSLGLSKRSWRR